jgi:phenylalanyl-tRNA synthetase beta chain
MKVGLRWLQELVPVDVPLEKLTELLDISGTKVEEVFRPQSEIKGVVVAEVLEISKHPNADTLTLVDVKTGDDDQRVVCGAKNFAVGDRVPLATVGSRLPGMEITERKIRGQVSRGMLCSASELGVSRDQSGILVLSPDAPLGEDVASLLELDDTTIELEITPNRPDCMSMVGVAREVGALLGHEVNHPDIEVAGSSELASPVEVDIKDPTRCPRYVARYLENVSIGSSPAWMAARLLRAGIRPISNVVDVTNYVMLELGQPLHAFDAAKIHNRRIVVRRAKSGERFTTLDGVERTMHEDDVMIADPNHAVAIGGVMGGEHSEISPDTTAVILESAYFDPATVALTARRQLIRTEASARFERGMDPEAPPRAAARAAKLIAETAGATVSETVTDAYPVEIQRARITLRPARTDALLGIQIAPTSQAQLLRSIELPVEESDGSLQVEVPGFRPDLRREADLIEEVARLASFDRLDATLPPGRIGMLEPDQVLDRNMRRALAHLGLHEAWNGSFMSAADAEALELTATPLRLSNPMSEDEALLRTSLLPGLLRSAVHNIAHRSQGVALFEIARVYEDEGQPLPQEATMLAAVFAGTRTPTAWNEAERSWDFFAAKGVLEALCNALGLSTPRFIASRGGPFHPTRAASLVSGGGPVGAFGELDPRLCDRLGVPEGTVVLELSVSSLVAQVVGKAAVAEVPKLPATYIDLAVVVAADIPAEKVEEVVIKAGEPEVVAVRLFDLYEGDQIGAGRKSLAYSLELRAPEKTITDEQALQIRDRIVAALAERVGAELRS